MSFEEGGGGWVDNNTKKLCMHSECGQIKTSASVFFIHSKIFIVVHWFYESMLTNVIEWLQMPSYKFATVVTFFTHYDTSLQNKIAHLRTTNLNVWPRISKYKLTGFYHYYPIHFVVHFTLK